MVLKKERRRSARYNLSDIAIIGIINPTSSSPEVIEDITASDFNTYGIGIETTTTLGIGDSLSLAIKSGSEETSIITAVVCNRSISNSSRNRYGLHFDLQSPLNNKSVDRHLASIEANARQVQRSFTFSS